MRNRTNIAATLAVSLLAAFGALVLAAGSAGSQTPPTTDDGAGETADHDTPLTGETLDRAVAAALVHTGGGEVTETETGDDGAAYGVEVRLPDGSQVEVNLDSDFEVIGSEPDDD